MTGPPQRGPLLSRVGRACANKPLRVLAVWLTVLVALGVWSHAERPTYSDQVTLHTQGYRGLELLHASEPGATAYAGRIVWHDAGSTVLARRASVTAALAAVSHLPHVSAVSNPFAPGGDAIAAGGHTGYALVQFDVIPKTLGADYVRRLDAAVSPMRRAGMEVDYGGDLDLLTQPQLSDTRSEAIGIGVALLVLLIGFGSVAAALLPLLTALLSVGIALSVLGVVATALTFATAAPTLAVMIGLGVAIDYALFLTTRFRQLVADGAEPIAAAGAASATSGHAVLVAATTVSVAIFGLYSSGLAFIGKLGLAAVMAVVVAAAGALTLVPAGLGLLGRRIDAVHVRAPVAESRSDGDGWHRYALLIGRRPLLFLLAGVSVLAVLAVPMWSMRLGHVDDGADPPSYSDRRAFTQIGAAFGPGLNTPFTVVVDVTRMPQTAVPLPGRRVKVYQLLPTPAPLRAMTASLTAALRSTPDVARVGALSPTADGRLLVGEVIPGSGPQARSTAALLHRIVGTVLPATAQRWPVAGYVTGSAALQLEFVSRVNSGLPTIIAVVVGAAFLLLLLTFRGLLLALKAAVLNLLSIAASYGVVVAVFQWGWGRTLIAVHEDVPIESYVPMMMFAIVFGLSLDYEVFLLSRVKEVWDVTGDHTRAVARGLASTARVITCAALIMASVFAAFVSSPSVVIKMIALGLACSILIDATVVRLVLVPAIMNLLGGPSSWWIPRWLDRALPSVGGSHRPLPAPVPARIGASREPPMRITLATLGSRGDVQPMVVLGRELHRRGHEVVMGVPPNLVAFVGRAGFAGYPIGPDSQAFVESRDGQRWLASGNVRAFFKAMGEVGHEMAPEGDAALIRACQGADLIVAGVLGEDHAVAVAEAARIPSVSLHLAPVRPTRSYPNFLVTTRTLPAALNLATGRLVDRVVWRTLRADTLGLRTELGLPLDHPTAPERARAGAVEIQAYSALLVPGLVDYGEHRPLTGFLTPDSALRAALGEAVPDAGLETWLAEGEPPAYFGFGSMPVLDPAAMMAMITAVSHRLGLRALVSAGWSDLCAQQPPDRSVRVVGALDHDSVLPRCRVAVHHGGAGTTAASTMAGIPTMVCSVFADQPFWGDRLARLGVGTHCRFTHLTPASLEAGLRPLLEPVVARRARALGVALASETGAAERAADIVERVAREARAARGAGGAGGAACVGAGGSLGVAFGSPPRAVAASTL